MLCVNIVKLFFSLLLPHTTAADVRRKPMKKANTAVDMCEFIIHKFVKDEIFTDENYAVTSNRQALYTDNQTTYETTK